MEKICKDCGRGFEISSGELEYFKTNKLNIPKRCKTCRKKNKKYGGSISQLMRNDKATRRDGSGRSVHVSGTDVTHIAYDYLLEENDCLSYEYLNEDSKSQKEQEQHVKPDVSWIQNIFTEGTRLYYLNKFNGKVEHVVVTAWHEKSFEFNLNGKIKHISYERANGNLFVDITDAPWYPEYLERSRRAEENYSYQPSLDSSVVFGE